MSQQQQHQKQTDDYNSKGYSSGGGKDRGSGSNKGSRTRPHFNYSSNNNKAAVYQGRKMVSNIQHLYEVVDDKEAYLSYDAVFGDHGGGGGGGSTEATLEDNLSDYSSVGGSVGMIREEELVDRMLSQFPVSL